MSKIFSSIMRLVIGIAIVGFCASTALAEDFYKGKMIRLIVGTPPGGGYDTYSRTIARHLTKHIPGNPNIFVQNMPGAGTLRAANYSYNKVKGDGLTVSVWSGSFALLQSLGDRGIKMDPQKVGWIGAPSKGTPICGIMGFTGLKTLNDVLKSKKRIKLGSTRAGSPYDDLPRILNKTLGTNFDIISGYLGTSFIRLAMQRREVDGACWTWESMKVSARVLLESEGDEKLIPYLIHNRQDDPEVKDLPLIPEMIKAKGGKEALATYEAWAGPYNFMRPWTVTRGTPKDRIDILRKAFAATMQDPGFLADAKRAKLALDFYPGEKIDKRVGEIISMSPKTKENLSFLVRSKRKKK